MASQIVGGSLKKSALAPRGWLVRVTSATKTKKWFAVGIYFQKIAETAVYDLPQIEPTDVAFARRRLKPAEIERLGLQRGEVVLCSLDEDTQLLGQAGQIHIASVGVIANTPKFQSVNHGNSKTDRWMLAMKEPKFEVPAELRNLAAKTVDQAEVAFGFFFDAAKKSLASIPHPAVTVSEHALSFTEQNIKAAFDHARKVVHVTNLQEAMQIQSEFLRSQFSNAGEHIRKITGEVMSGAKEASRGKIAKP